MSEEGDSGGVHLGRPLYQRDQDDEQDVRHVVYYNNNTTTLVELKYKVTRYMYKSWVAHLFSQYGSDD